MSDAERQANGGMSRHPRYVRNIPKIVATSEGSRRPHARNWIFDKHGQNSPLLASPTIFHCLSLAGSNQRNSTDENLNYTPVSFWVCAHAMAKLRDVQRSLVSGVFLTGTYRGSSSDATETFDALRNNVLIPEHRGICVKLTKQTE